MNDINELRTVLFDTLRKLSDKDNPMDPERARAINETAQVIINSAKVEVDHLRVAGGAGTGFITQALPNGGSSNTATGTKTVTPIAGGAVIQHRMK